MFDNVDCDYAWSALTLCAPSHTTYIALKGRVCVEYTMRHYTLCAKRLMGGVCAAIVKLACRLLKGRPNGDSDQSDSRASWK